MNSRLDKMDRGLRAFLPWCFVLLAVLMAVAAAPYVPSSYKPWVPLDLTAAPGPFTETKLGLLKGDYPACIAALEGSQAQFTPVPDRTAGTCDLTGIVALEEGLYPYSAPVRTQCALMAALVLWEREVVQKHAAAILGEEIARIDHGGIFSCRNVRGSSTRRSQHASANAIDIFGFQLKNGETINIRRHYEGEGPKGEFLRAVNKGSCAMFRGVLGPNYNALHADHFHLDMGPYSICR